MLHGDSIGPTMLSLTLIQLLGRDPIPEGLSPTNRAVLVPVMQSLRTSDLTTHPTPPLGASVMFHARAVRVAPSSDRTGEEIGCHDRRDGNRRQPAAVNSSSFSLTGRDSTVISQPYGVAAS